MPVTPGHGEASAADPVERPRPISPEMRRLAQILPVSLRAHLGFALQYSHELSAPVPEVFFGELTGRGRLSHRVRLAANVLPVVDGLGLTLDPRTDPGAVREVLVRREYDWPGFVPDDRWTVLDVGAEHGEFSLLSSVSRGARALAFEPVPENVEILRENVRRNRGERITIYPFGLGEEDGVLVGRRYETMLVRAPPNAPGREVRVEQRRLDGLSIAAPGGPVLMKIDVEGFEIEVLHGSRAFIRTYQPRIVVEVDEASESHVRALLAEFAYSVVGERAKPVSKLLFALPSSIPPASVPQPRGSP